MRVCDNCLTPSNYGNALIKLILPYSYNENEVVIKNVELCERCSKQIIDANKYIYEGIDERRKILEGHGDNK